MSLVRLAGSCRESGSRPASTRPLLLVDEDEAARLEFGGGGTESRGRRSPRARGCRRAGAGAAVASAVAVAERPARRPAWSRSSGEQGGQGQVRGGNRLCERLISRLEWIQWEVRCRLGSGIDGSGGVGRRGSSGVVGLRRQRWRCGRRGRGGRCDGFREVVHGAGIQQAAVVAGDGVEVG